MIAPSVIENDYKTAQGYPAEQQLRYMMMYQLTRLTRLRGALRNDDRLDALSIACNYWVEQMAQDADMKIKERRDDLASKQLDEFMDAYYKRTTRSQSSWI